MEYLFNYDNIEYDHIATNGTNPNDEIECGKGDFDVQMVHFIRKSILDWYTFAGLELFSPHGVVVPNNGQAIAGFVHKSKLVAVTITNYKIN